MTRLVDAAFANARVVMTALVVMIVFGFAAFKTIPREADPDIPVPFVLVTLPLPGVSPEDGERLLIRPTEIELRNLEGLKQMDSLAYDGAAQIFLEFVPTIDIDQAVLDVREAVDRAKAEYPADAEEPVIREFNIQTEFPILSVILHGPAPERALYQAAKRLEDALQSSPGVLEANLVGAREELLEVIVDPATLENYGLTVREVVETVTANNQLVTAGALDLEDGRFAVKAPGLVRSPEDVAAIPLRADGDRVVTIGDVAEARRAFVDRAGYALFNGQPAIGVEITKRAGANIVETIEEARRITERHAQFWPATIRHAYLNDQSVFVRDTLEGLTSSVVTAILLVMIVVVAALGPRSALMIGVAIPTSFLIAFFLLSLFGYTLNMMVMFGLVLAVGMLVDGAIVIVEYADRRMNEGASRRSAYAEASKRMFWPVTTSTATTLAAFIPFLFWRDIAGEFMKYLPLTLIFVLSASLVVALIFLPVLGSLLGIPKWMKEKFGLRGKTDRPRELEIEEVDPATLDSPLGVYARALRAIIQRPLIAISTACTLVAICLGSFMAASPDMEFFLRTDSEDVNILVRARGNLSAQQKLDIVQDVARRIEDHPAIEHIYLQTGPGLARNLDLPADTVGQIGIDLVPYAQREHSRIVSEQFRARVESAPGVVVEVRQREGGPPVGKDVQVELSSPDLDALFEAARKTRAFIDEAEIKANGRIVPAYMDREDTLPLPGVEWAIEVDRAQAGRYGLSVREAGAMVQLVTDGLLIDKYRPDDSDEEIDIRVRFPEEHRSIFALDSIRVQTPQGAAPLSNFVAREARPQVDRIQRRNGRRIVEVKANGNTRIPGHEVSQDQAIALMKNWLESGALGDDVEWIMRGADEETVAAASFFEAAMAAAMFMIAMILLLEFNSFYHAGLTLSAVILSVFGVLLGIAITGQYVSVIMTGTGVVALAGIVVNNNIVLIDTYQHLRKKGLAVEEAVIRAAAQRARPVLLTTATTIMGLLPMVFELNVDFAAGTISRGSTTSDWWVLLASAVVYGLAFSTVLTLALTPVMLAAPAVLRRRLPDFGDRALELLAQTRIRPRNREAAPASVPSREERPRAAE
ncbi:efflux RND transporter permease subunit [Amphiplicatus metriothermophilus]|uniref:Multidrug efflux pump n=1 Tax=Amphiplicatus metriothermophilus TaxID=1519374 RepID=A0A239PJM0_9PROT|nr:efflux RND transporter permease subunit [Amphiplicatus metriothermophilus]MBB5517839.1 multidrug efflux pump [Amphiplicatus metriothermophilus]SNT67827.1 multidrug efflux pump [Amphiplicatus metriothermophilus]